MIDIVVNGESLDLSGEDKIVQTIQVLNFDNVSTFNADYSNEFNIPITNKNLTIIDNSNYVNSQTDFPYLRNDCIIYIDGFEFKRGYLELVEIDETIKLRFYTGSILFFNLIKDKKLGQLNWSDYDHVWNLSNAISSFSNTEGYIYPVIDYNGMSSSTPIVDVRRILPSTFSHTIMKKIIEENGYSIVNGLTGQDLLDYESDITPYAKEDPSLDSDVIAQNSFDVTGDIQFNNEINVVQTNGSQININSSFTPVKFNFITDNLNNGSTVYNLISDTFSPSLSALYKFTLNVNIDIQIQNFCGDATIQSDLDFNQAYNVVVEIGYDFNNTFNVLYSDTFIGSGISTTCVVNMTTPLFYIPAGNQIYCRYKISTSSYSTSLAGVPQVINIDLKHDYFNPVFTGEIDLSFVFGQMFPFSATLPDITCGDFFKDTCIRYGLLPIIDEYNKIIYLNPFSVVKNNIQYAVDWSDKLDETNKPNIKFKISDYCQNNYYKHKEDKSIELIPFGSDYNLSINNQNLKFEKTLYESIFAPSEDVQRLGTHNVIYIDLYDATTSAFTKSVEPRRAIIEKKNISVDFTDGTTTTTVTLNIPFTRFIDYSKPFNMGFASNMIPKFSEEMIAVLQKQKIVTENIKLNLLDILNLNFYHPVYLKQHNAYFFISSINQFSFTSSESTEVVLVKLN